MVRWSAAGEPDARTAVAECRAHRVCSWCSKTGPKWQAQRRQICDTTQGKTHGKRFTTDACKQPPEAHLLQSSSVGFGITGTLVLLPRCSLDRHRARTGPRWSGKALRRPRRSAFTRRLCARLLSCHSGVLQLLPFAKVVRQRRGDSREKCAGCQEHLHRQQG